MIIKNKFLSVISKLEVEPNTGSIQNDNEYWITKYNKKLKISEMRTLHIKNSINKIGELNR